MGMMQEKWGNIPNGIRNVLFIFTLACLVMLAGLNLREVKELVPALENLPVNWLKAYDFARLTAEDMLYPLQYVGMLVWGRVPLWIFRLVFGATSEFSMVLLAAWYKLLEMSLLYMVYVYVGKIIEFYQCKELSNVSRLVCAVPIILYGIFWKESWNVVIALLLLMGLYYFLKNRMFLFVLCFLFGVLCHPAALLFYIPLVFWKNGRVKGICDYLLCLLLPLGMEFMMFASSEGFRSLFGEVVKMQGWLDLIVWAICIVLSVLFLLDRKHQHAKCVLYSYILISLCLWSANGMKEGYLLFLAILVVIVCLQIRNTNDNLLEETK